MKDKIDWELIGRYLTEECTNKEIELAERLINADSQVKDIVDQFQKIIGASIVRPPKSNVNDLWNKLAKEAGIQVETGSLKTKAVYSKKMKKQPVSIFRLNSWPRVYKYAAMFLLIVSIPIMYMKYFNNSSSVYDPSEMKEVFVAFGEQSVFTLEDGTQVTLDAGSSLSYPEKFRGNSRDVFLNGEGYFEVSHDPENPFVVHADNAEIEVLGTEFNVRAWHRHGQIKVAVIEGKVSLNASESSIKEAVVITEGEMSTLSQNGKPSKPQRVDVEKHIAWLNYEMEFNSVQLSEVLYQMERWYNIEINADDPKIQNLKITMLLTKRSIRDNLEFISTLANLDYTLSGNTVNLRKK